MQNVEKISNQRRVLMFGLVGALVAGCAGGRSSKSTGDYVDDAAITSKVKAALLKDPVVGGLAIDVDTTKGRVRLGGTAKSETERSKAAELARSVNGVLSVQNDIVVK